MPQEPERRAGGRAAVRAEQARAARAAATSIASSLGLAADDALVLHDSNTLTLRLIPCDVVARVAPAAQQVAQLEVDVARKLTALGGPVAGLDPRVQPRPHERDGFVVTFWTHHEAPAWTPSPQEYADALARLHSAMRRVDVPAPHVTDRVEQAQRLVADRGSTPALADADRKLLDSALRHLRRSVAARGAAEQLLHGEPHPGNVLATTTGLRFIDLETCCRGPVEFDVAHLPEAVSVSYPGIDRGLLRDCRLLVLAMVTTWRWDAGDQLPDGRRLGTEWLGRLRSALGDRALTDD